VAVRVLFFHHQNHTWLYCDSGIGYMGNAVGIGGLAFYLAAFRSDDEIPDKLNNFRHTR
jgi:hypothetical protein